MQDLNLCEGCVEIHVKPPVCWAFGILGRQNCPDKGGEQQEDNSFKGSVAAAEKWVRFLTELSQNPLASEKSEQNKAILVKVKAKTKVKSQSVDKSQKLGRWVIKCKVHTAPSHPATE